jgi:molecular chaperone DnaK (HSP70)
MLIEARNEAETVLRHAEKAVVQGAALLSEPEKEEISHSLADLKAAIQGKDHHAIREKLDRLDKATQHLAELLMDQSIKEALQNKKLTDV